MSIIIGRKAVQVHSSNDVVRGGRWRHQELIDQIRDAKQSRRPIRELIISVLVNGELRLDRISPQNIEEDPEWPKFEINVSSSDLSKHISKSSEEAGLLCVSKSVNQLKGRNKDLNTLFVVDSDGNPIGYYPIHELNFGGHSPLSSFIQAEIQLKFDGVSDFIMNDRERLVDTSLTKDILKWCSEMIWERITQIEKSAREKEKKTKLEIASQLNDSLNKHAKRFLKKIQTEIMVDFIDDQLGGGLGSGGGGVGGTKGSSGDGGQRTKGVGGGLGSGGDLEKPGNKQKTRRLAYPQILLSSMDKDPAQDYLETKYLSERHPPLNQDDVDRSFNVWWLNTSHPYASEALKRGGAEGYAFKSHHLSMFRDMVQREALRILQRREVELPLDRIENELDEISNRFLADLPYTLIEELFE